MKVVWFFIGKVLNVLSAPLINRLAFFPEPSSSSTELPDDTSEVFIKSAGKTSIHGYLLRSKGSDELLIYFHGNWGNIDFRLSELAALRNLGINVLGISYRGYGKSGGTPSEYGIYRDGELTLNYARTELGFSGMNINIMGRSLGSTVAIELASKFQVRRLVLVTPLTSGRCQLKAVGKSFIAILVGNAFNNLYKVSKITCPVLFIHGSDDKITPQEMSARLYGLINGEKHLTVIDNADHNNISTTYKEEYERALVSFWSCR